MKPDAPRQSTPIGFGRGGGARGMMGGPVQKPKHFKKTLRTFGSYLVPYKFKLVIVVVFAIISTVFMIISPRLLGDVTNEIVDGYVNGQTYDHIKGALPKGTTLPV